MAVDLSYSAFLHDMNQRSKAMTEQANETTQEDADMATVRAVFEKASNAIVDASRLSKLVAELEVKVNGLVRDIDYLRDQNKRLDEQLGYVRRERDDLRDKLRSTEAERDHHKANFDSLSADKDRLQNEHDAMTLRWYDASKERDDAMLREMELQDKLKEATATLDAIMKVLHPLKEVPTAEVKQEVPSQFAVLETGPETTEERERREAQSRDEAGRFGPKVVGFDY